MAGNYTIENLYEPGYKSFKISEDSPYMGKDNFMPAHQLGVTTDPSTANQIAALSQALNQGISVMEVGTLGQNVFETIPKQHFAEMRRKAKLAKAQVTLHAPVQGTDPSGFGERGYDEVNRQAIEMHLKDVMDKAIDLDVNGNMPVTIHGSNINASTFKYRTNEKGEREKVHDQLIAVDRVTGQITPIKEDIKYYARPETDEKKIITKLGTVERKSPIELLEMHNETTWDDAMQKIEFQREAAEKAMQNVDTATQIGLTLGKIPLETPESVNAYRNLGFAREHLQEASREAQAEFSRAYQIAKDTNNKEQMDALDAISKAYQEELNMEVGKPVPVDSLLPYRQSMALGHLVASLRSLPAPEQFTPMEDFAVEKASDTFSNVALYAYKKKGEKAPVLSIENLYQGMGFSQGEDLKNLIVKSRSDFVDKAVKSKDQGGLGLSKSQAKKAADKMIGVTFDVGHLNMSRKYGFTEKDLLKEAEPVKEFVNKVHLTDNFGSWDTHLPPGMGNVPVRALMEALGEKAAKAIKINEVGGWINYFKTSPFPQILEAYGSPIYASSKGPYWSQAGGFQQSYLEGYGQMLPQTNYQLFGAGFSQLPQSLGGSMQQNAGGRMGGGGF